MSRDILEEQLEYYRARAPEYDASVNLFRHFGGGHSPGEEREWMEAARALHALGPCRRALELAGGTGLWTREPDREFDLVFFAFWLSHVPPDRNPVAPDRAPHPGPRHAAAPRRGPRVLRGPREASRRDRAGVLAPRRVRSRRRAVLSGPARGGSGLRGMVRLVRDLAPGGSPADPDRHGGLHGTAGPGGPSGDRLLHRHGVPGRRVRDGDRPRAARPRLGEPRRPPGHRARPLRQRGVREGARALRVHARRPGPVTRPGRAPW